MKKFKVHVFGENPCGFWHRIYMFSSLEEARAHAKQEKLDDEVYEIYIRYPGGEKENVIGA